MRIDGKSRELPEYERIIISILDAALSWQRVRSFILLV